MCWCAVKNLHTHSSQGNPSIVGVKRKRGSRIERCHVRVSHLLMSFLLCCWWCRAWSKNCWPFLSSTLSYRLITRGLSISRQLSLVSYTSGCRPTFTTTIDELWVAFSRAYYRAPQHSGKAGYCFGLRLFMSQSVCLSVCSVTEILLIRNWRHLVEQWETSLFGLVFRSVQNSDPAKVKPKMKWIFLFGLSPNFGLSNRLSERLS